MRLAADQIGMDLAEHASKRASEAVLQALSLCETREQAMTVAFKATAVVAALAAGVFAERSGVPVAGITAADGLQMMSDIMREQEGRT